MLNVTPSTTKQNEFMVTWVLDITVQTRRTCMLNMLIYDAVGG